MPDLPAALQPPFSLGRATSNWIVFLFYAVPRGGRGTRPRLTTLKCMCGPGDDAEPVLTILTLTED